MVATITIDVPDTVQEFISAKAVAGGYPNPGEYVLDLLQRQQQRDTIEEQLLAAVESADFEEVTPEFWSRLRARVVERQGDDASR